LARDIVGPVLSPDGEKVAILDSDTPDSTRLSIWMVRGSTRLTNYKVLGARALSWTPDGRSVLVVREHGNRELLTFDVK
jgi:hypothetical protein